MVIDLPNSYVHGPAHVRQPDAVRRGGDRGAFRRADGARAGGVGAVVHCAGEPERSRSGGPRGAPAGPLARHGGVSLLRLAHASVGNAAYFSQYRTVCVDCGADPRSAADAPVRLAAVWM